MLKTEAFCERVVQYIKANFRAYLPGLESAESIREIPKIADIGFSRPPDPKSVDYEEQLRKRELDVARSCQIHVCDRNRCLKLGKDGRYYCKRRAPFELAAEDFIEENGAWGPKRLYGYVNNWIPGVLVNCGCNDDGKFLTNGRDANNITHYVTEYTTKPQGKNYNESAVIAKALAYDSEHPNKEYEDSIQNAGRLLLFRVMSALNREQEIAAPLVISYLMGWGDHYTSHTYTAIYWDAFQQALCRAFPELRYWRRAPHAVVPLKMYPDTRLCTF
ncbi:hypothetical protein F5880DRAFT_1490169 [Lentinula raphanica]|nr:hypothetical protein F5880DRAFT_1490169 [Lentinula raphanica]